MKVFQIIYLFPILSILISCQSQGSITLFDQDKTMYAIVLPDKPSTHEQKAALVLQDYLKRITRHEFPITSQGQHHGENSIFIGRNQNAKFQDDIQYDGFAIETQGKDLLIYGNSGKGTLYGVYNFLEKYLNCQKPVGGEPAIVPSLNSVKLHTNIKDIQSPDFIYRQSYYPSSQDPEYLDWHKLQHFEDLWGLWGHSFFKIIEPDRYFNTHPEYFALVAGKRQQTQLCLSNKEVQRLTIDYFKREIGNNPDAVYWSISPMDNLGYCRCDDCQKVDQEEGGPQGSLIRFVNKIATQFPDIKLTTLAYTYSSKPPLKTKPAANVYVMLSSIDALRTQPLEKEPTAQGFRDNLKAWAAVTENIFIWDYTTQFTNYLTPFPDYNHIEKNTSFLKSQHVKGIFFHGSEENFSDMAAFNSFLQAKALWKADVIMEKQKEIFLKSYYGTAAPLVAMYIQQLEEGIKRTHSQLDIYGNPINDRSSYLSPEQIDLYSSLLDEAQGMVENEQLYLKHMEEIRLGLEYVVLQQSKSYGIAKHGYLIYNDDKEVYEINPKWKNRVARFVETAKSLGVNQLAEVGPNIDTYKQSWDELFEKGWVDNEGRHALLTLLNSFSEEYPANGLNTLIDGIDGQKDFSYNWLLFYGKNLEANFDFKKEKEIKNISIGFLHDPKHYIFSPIEIKILASEDGIHFKEITRKIIPTSEENFDIKREVIHISIPYFASFYKVIAVCPTKLPTWRFHATKKPTIAVDEILIN